MCSRCRLACFFFPVSPGNPGLLCWSPGVYQATRCWRDIHGYHGVVVDIAFSERAHTIFGPRKQSCELPSFAVSVSLPAYAYWVLCRTLVCSCIIGRRDSAATKPVSLLLLFPEDFGGEPKTGPASIWALECFRSLQGVGETRRQAAFLCTLAGADQRRPLGVLTNVSALDEYLYDGWPNLQEQHGRLCYCGHLPHNCPCLSPHKPSTGLSHQGFNSSAQPLLTTIFWARVFCASPSLSAPVTLRDGSSVFSMGPSTFHRRLVRSQAHWMLCSGLGFKGRPPGRSFATSLVRRAATVF